MLTSKYFLFGLKSKVVSRVRAEELRTSISKECRVSEFNSCLSVSLAELSIISQDQGKLCTKKERELKIGWLI